MNSVIAATILAIVTGIFIVWFFKKLTDTSLKM